jgi:hypothetical protein
VVLGGIGGGRERRVVTEEKVSSEEEFGVADQDLFLRSSKRETDSIIDTEGLAEADEKNGG